MTFEDFKQLPKDLQKEYITYIRETFDAPDSAIARMFDMGSSRLSLYIRDCGASKGIGAGNKTWKEAEFNAWLKNETINYTSLSEPMTYAEFRQLPVELQKAYLEYISERFDNPPYSAIGTMMGVANNTLSAYATDLGITRGRGSGGKRNWKKNEFYAWIGGADMEADVAPVEATEVEVEPKIVEVEPAAKTEPAIVFNVMSDINTQVETKEEPKTPAENNTECFSTERPRAIPISGNMTFRGTTESVLNTLNALLGNKEVVLTVSWTVND